MLISIHLFELTDRVVSKTNPEYKLVAAIRKQLWKPRDCAVRHVFQRTRFRRRVTVEVAPVSVLSAAVLYDTTLIIVLVDCTLALRTA